MEKQEESAGDSCTELKVQSCTECESLRIEIENLRRDLEGITHPPGNHLLSSDSTTTTTTTNCDKMVQVENDDEGDDLVRSGKKRRKLTTTETSTNSNSSNANSEDENEIINSNIPLQINQTHPALQNLLILREILLNLNCSSFHSFRLVAPFWNKVALPILTNLLSSTQLQFHYQSTVKGKYYTRLSSKTRLSKPPSSSAPTPVDSTLSNFIEAFRSCTKFPFSFVTFKWGSLSTPDITQFFSLYGHHIKTLKLIMKSTVEYNPHSAIYTTVRTIRQILTTGVPSVEKLILQGTPDQWSQIDPLYNNPLFPEPSLPSNHVTHSSTESATVPLKNLKILNLGRDYANPQILRDILRTAAKLEQTVYVYPSELWILSSTSKLNTIKDFTFTLFPTPEKMVDCQAFADALPQLEELGFTFESNLFSRSTDFTLRRQLGKIISTVLSSSSSSLQMCQLCPVGFVPSLKFPPQFPRVTALTLSDQKEFYKELDEDEEEDGRIPHLNHKMFPPGDENRMSEMFPNLVHVILEMEVPRGLPRVPEDPDAGENYYGSWESVFGWDNIKPLNGVRRIKITGVNDETCKWFPKISKFFPNVEKLQMAVVAINFAGECCSGIWKWWGGVKVVRIEIVMKRISGEEEERQVDEEEIGRNERGSWCLDPVFTGMSSETCADLLRNSRNVTIEQAKGLREGLSILNMKNLKSLDICFNMTDSGDMLRDIGTQRTIILSHVTGIYGFKAMKQQLSHELAIQLRWNGSTYFDKKAQRLETALESVLDFVDGPLLEMEDDA